MVAASRQRHGSAWTKLSESRFWAVVRCALRFVGARAEKLASCLFLSQHPTSTGRAARRGKQPPFPRCFVVQGGELTRQRHQTYRLTAADASSSNALRSVISCGSSSTASRRWNARCHGSKGRVSAWSLFGPYIKPYSKCSCTGSLWSRAALTHGLRKYSQCAFKVPSRRTA